MPQEYCFFCRTPASKSQSAKLNTIICNCPVCGIYEVVWTLVDELDRHYQSYGTTTQDSSLNWRQLQLQCVSKLIEFSKQYPKSRIIWVGSEPKSENEQFQQLNIWEVAKIPMNHQEKESKLVNLFCAQSEKHGDPFSTVSITQKDCWRLKIYPGDGENPKYEELNLWLQSLEKDGLISNRKVGDGSDIAFGKMATLKLTPKVWKLREAQKLGSNRVFIATAFSWPENESQRVEVIKKIKEACGDLGYEASVVSQHHHDNISVRILNEIKNSKFVIAEFTYNNRGVYFEAGYARGLGMPVFHVVKDGFDLKTIDADKAGKKLHFDIEQVMYRKYTTPDDLYEQLKNWIENTVGKFRYDNS